MSKIKTVGDLIKRLENLPKDLPLLAGIRNSDGGFDMVDIGVSADPAGDPNIDNCLLILTPKSPLLKNIGEKTQFSKMLKPLDFEAKFVPMKTSSVEEVRHP